MIYSIDEIKQKITPIAIKYKIPTVYIFGSYARNEATAHSDVDILIDSDGSDVTSLFDLGALYDDLCKSLNKEIDLLTMQSLEQQEKDGMGVLFIDSVVNEGVVLYERA